MTDTATEIDDIEAGVTDETEDGPIMAVGKWKSNAELMVDVAKLYIPDDASVLDCTFGYGIWWKLFTPTNFTGCDFNEAKSPIGYSVDFRNMPFETGSFDVVAYDPPYKLNGRPDPELDERYGTDERTRWQDRMQICLDGIPECVRVAVPGGLILARGMDQVVSGAVRWQMWEYARVAESLGCTIVDRFDFFSYRPQDPNRTKKHQVCKGQGCVLCDGTGQIAAEQVHARRNYSSLLVIQTPKKRRDPDPF